MKVSSFARFAFLVLAASAVAALPARGAFRPNGNYYYVLNTINGERASQRVGPLAIEPRLSAIAQSHANDMARRNYFSHITPEGVDPFGRMRRAGYVFRAAGENISVGGNVQSAQLLIWNEPAHRAILLRPFFGHVGIGLARGRGGVILVEDFSD